MKKIWLFAVKALFFFPEVYPPLRKMIRSRMDEEVTIEDLPNKKELRLPVFTLFSLVLAFGFTSNIFLFRPGIYISLVLCIFAMTIIIALNIRTVKIQSWYQHLLASEHNLIKDSFYDTLNCLESNREQRKALEKTPFLKSLASSSVLWLLLFFPIIFQSLHIVFGFLPEAKGFNFLQWFLIAGESVLKSLLLDTFEIFNANLTAIPLQSNHRWMQAIIWFFRLISDALIVNLLLGIILGTDDPIEESAKLKAREAWAGDQKSLDELNNRQQSEEVLYQFNKDIKRSLSEWFGDPNLRLMTNDLILKTLALEVQDASNEHSKGQYPTLNLSECQNINASGYQSLLAIKELKELDLSRCIITKESAIFLSQLNLNKLILSYAKLDSSVLKILFNDTSPLAKSIKKLKINQIKSLDHQSLSAIQHCKNLTHIDLSELNQITDDDIDAALESLSQLELLIMRGCSQISNIMVELIKDYHPTAIVRIK